MSEFEESTDIKRSPLPPPRIGLPTEIICRDGVRLGGHFWTAAQPAPIGTVIINPATGVLARYYHHYSRFLVEQGFDVLTYDYRGIGLSRPKRLRGSGYRWKDWGELDFDAALLFARDHRPDAPILVVGHSVGGFLPGLSENAEIIHRMLTVGAQYGYWRDYAPEKRLQLFLKWHLAMPLTTSLFGYFPGKRLGWLEDLPAGVANEWSFMRARMELKHSKDLRHSVLERFAKVTAPILAIIVSDDEIGTAAAIRRTLAYYTRADRSEVILSPVDLGLDAVGHFSLFHARHTAKFWPDTVRWLRDGTNPWQPGCFSDEVATG